MNIKKAVDEGCIDFNDRVRIYLCHNSYDKSDPAGWDLKLNASIDTRESVPNMRQQLRVIEGALYMLEDLKKRGDELSAAWMRSREEHKVLIAERKAQEQAAYEADKPVGDSNARIFRQELLNEAEHRPNETVEFTLETRGKHHYKTFGIRKHAASGRVTHRVNGFTVSKKRWLIDAADCTYDSWNKSDCGVR